MNEINREQLESDAVLQFVSVGETAARLLRLAQNGTPLAVPFADEDGPLMLETWSPSRGLVSFELAPLFADLVDLTRPVEPDALAPVHEILARWSERSIVSWVDVLYRAAADLVAGGAAPRDAASASEFVRRGGNPDVALRLAIVFASLAEARDGAAAERTAQLRGALLPGDAPWQTPFHETASGDESFVLRPDVPARLAPFERILAARYAGEVLRWDPSDDPAAPAYPVWLS